MDRNDLQKAPPITRRHFLLTLGAVAGSAAVGSQFWHFGKDILTEPDKLQVAKRTGFALGAEMSIVALHENSNIAEQAIDAAFTELETVESVMSLCRPQSQLCRLNREGVLYWPHPFLVKLLQEAQTMSAASGGNFDITVQPFWTLYANAKKEGRLPSTDEIDRIRRLVDWRRVEVSADCIRLIDNGTAVTLNGIAQGFAADCALGAIAAHGVRHALVNTGEVGVMGRRQDRDLWTVGIQHPRYRGAFISRPRLDARCMATSGDYATTFSADGECNHIFDPRTGQSPKEFQSVTVLAKSGLEADALSTAVFVSGLHLGIRLIESTTGADALFVLKNGKTLTTSGFPGEVQIFKKMAPTWDEVLS